MPDSHNAATQSSGLTLLLECVFFLGASFLFSVITWPAQKYMNLNKQTKRKKEENGEKQKMWEKKPVRLIQFISERNFVYLRCFLFQADLLQCCKCRKCCLRKCTTKAYRTGQRRSGLTGGGQGDGREGKGGCYLRQPTQRCKWVTRLTVLRGLAVTSTKQTQKNFYDGEPSVTRFRSRVLSAHVCCPLFVSLTLFYKTSSRLFSFSIFCDEYDVIFV